MKDTRRLFTVLSVLVRRRQAMTVREVRRALPKGNRAHVRTVQRDLVSLRRWSGIKVDKSRKPFRWSFPDRKPCPCCWNHE